MEKTCDYIGCGRIDTTPCSLTIYSFDISVFEALRYGLRQVWRLWRDGYIDVIEGYYCAKHAREEGFCWGCGQFCAGMERFDFCINGQWMCDNCWDNLVEEEEEEDYYPGLWDE